MLQPIPQEKLASAANQQVFIDSKITYQGYGSQSKQKGGPGKVQYQRKESGGGGYQGNGGSYA
jgi:hypothetical protein